MLINKMMYIEQVKRTKQASISRKPSVVANDLQQLFERDPSESVLNTRRQTISKINLSDPTSSYKLLNNVMKQSINKDI